LLGPTAFGEVQTLVSVFLQLMIFLAVLGLVTVNIVANYKDEETRNKIVFDLERIALVISLVALVLSVIFRHKLQTFFRFDDSLPFVLLVLTVVISVPFTFRSAFLRGKQRFGKATWVNVLASVSKIIFSAVLIVVGFKTAGAIFGIALAQFTAFCLVAYWAWQLGLRRSQGAALHSKPDLKLLLPELKYAGLVLVGSLIITLQFSIDIVVVKHFFDAHLAGLYAGVAAVARIIFFLTGSISQVLMPSLKLEQSPAHNKQLLVKSFWLLCLSGLPALALFVVAPGWIISVLMGGQYLPYAGLLPELATAIFMISVVNLLVSYYLALRRYTIALVVIIGAVVTYALMAMHHNTIRAVVDSLFLGSLSMIVLIACLGAWQRLSKQKRARG